MSFEPMTEQSALQPIITRQRNTITRHELRIAHLIHILDAALQGLPGWREDAEQEVKR